LFSVGASNVRVLWQGGADASGESAEQQLLDVALSVGGCAVRICDAASGLDLAASLASARACLRRSAAVSELDCGFASLSLVDRSAGGRPPPVLTGQVSSLSSY